MNSTFDKRVEALVEQLGEDIAAISKDENEYLDGLMIAVGILLEQGEDDGGSGIIEVDDLDDAWDNDEDEYVYDQYVLPDDDDEIPVS